MTMEKKTVAINLKTLRSGDPAAIRQMGMQELSQVEILQKAADENAHDLYQRDFGYISQRVAEYPAIGDQLDEIWKGFAALRAGQPLPKTTLVMLDRVAQVKALHPKPDSIDEML